MSDTPATPVFRVEHASRSSRIGVAIAVAAAAALAAAPW